MVSNLSLTLPNSLSKRVDVIIDFTIPKCTISIVLKKASKLKKRVVIGTTGFTQKEEKI